MAVLSYIAGQGTEGATKSTSSSVSQCNTSAGTVTPEKMNASTDKDRLFRDVISNIYG